jgi:hypothetical protein
MVMSKVKHWIVKKLTATDKSKNITDEMREKALEIRRQNYRLRQLEKQAEMQQRFEALESMIHSEKKGNSFEETLVSQVLPILLSKLNKESTDVNYSKPTYQTRNITEVNLTDQQIKQMLKQNPKLKENGKIATDEQIHEFLINAIPNISQNSIKKVICEVRK